ncbi:hydrolase-HD superfamily protein [Saprolegnia diclina VS20]|uniref:5'-deoxynucleotidase n=1 Tax=Saprolegnia diclina (strain VS20) TaxID=1156394 RepID=T0PSL2_SAPDV|nr:hydrolase-HD superfamily protein [Saprolegnia diclina VS20]EQC28454.1 hydrolase-HD superfamily protein [Saprolegnia diclina VS20]|eukprot:XP_008618102.1 hydrolase-HD superfamily protein [Saprolegnia diclina VS20]
MTTRGISASSALDFLRVCGQLKRLKRTGWVNHQVHAPESVSDHMYRLAMCSLLLDNDSSVDRMKCIKMAIVHDLAEAFVGDITPHDGVSDEDKHKLERDAIDEICTKLGAESQAAKEIRDLWFEYENASTDEAKMVKDFDKFEMILQADEYESVQAVDLQDFFNSTQGKFKTPLVQSWVQELNTQRDARKTSTE